MSPFEIFRRNLKPLMVFLTLLALFAFVVLPAMDTYLRRGGSGGMDPQVAVFDGVPVLQSRVDYLTRNHQSTVRFLRDLATETIRRGGNPRTPGFVYDTQSKTIRSIGIDERPSPLSTVRTLQFAAEANKAGFELDDAAIKSWLNRYTDNTMTDGEILSLLMQTSRNQMGQFHLYEQLRQQLLAELYQRGAMAGVVEGQFPILSPAEQWANFLKINQKATIDSYGVLVNDYIDQTNASPPESVIESVYKKGVQRFPNEQSPDPGFRRRETATFEYLVADMKSFVDREIEKVGEDALKAEYEKRLKGGEFQLPDIPEAEEQEQEQPEASEPEGPTAEPPQTDEQAAADADDASTEKEEMQQEASDTSEQKSDADKADSVNGDAGQAKADSEDDAANFRQAVESFKKELDAVRQEAQQEASQEDQSQTRRAAAAVRLVAYAQNESAEDESAEEESAEEESAEAESAVKESDTPAAEQQAEQAAEEPQAKTESDEKPKVETFEDVRDRIAQSLAGPPARKKIDAALIDVENVMRRYFNEKAIYDSDVASGRKDAKKPEKPNLQALAEKLGLEFQAVGPHDIVSIGAEPISQSNVPGAQLGRRGPSFATMMYGVQSTQQFIPKQQLFSPLRTTDTAARRDYVAWKVAEEEGYLPDLDEVRADVIMAIRVGEARELARAVAEAIAVKVNAGEPLASVIPEDKQDNFKEGLGPFSWMNSFGFQGAFLGNVPELDSVGEEFMKAVFTTEVGKASVAANLPQRAVYVVKPTGLQPHIDDLKQIFKQPQERLMALPLGSNDVRSILQGFYKSVDERTGFNFADDESMQ